MLKIINKIKHFNALSFKWVLQPVKIKHTPFWIALFALVFLLIMREPDALFKPVFWAEECSIYFKQASEQGPIGGLLYYYQRSCRFELLMNVAVTIASLLPLKLAPYITASTALTFYMITFALILRWPLYGIVTPLQRVLACIGVLLYCYTMSYVFLSTAVIQQLLGACALILLLVRSDKLSYTMQIFSLILLFICGLTGMYAIFLLPAFILKAIWKRDKLAIAQLCILTTCAAIQVGLLLVSTDKSYLVNHRMNSIGLDTMTMLLQTMIIKTLFGPYATDIVASFLSSHLWLSTFIVVTLLITITLGVYYRANELSNWLLLVSLLCVTAGVTYGAAGVPDNRYAALTRVVMLLFLLSNTALLKGDRPWMIMKFLRQRVLILTKQCILTGLIIFSLLTGMTLHCQPMARSFRLVPSWIEEIDRLRNHDAYMVAVYPAPFWKVDLRPGFSGSPSWVKIHPGQIYDIDDIVPWIDYFQLTQTELPKSERRYITQSTVSLVLKVERAGRYQLQALTWALNDKHDSWCVRTDWNIRREIKWTVPKSHVWEWNNAPEIWNLKPGRYNFLLIPSEPTPLAAIKVVQIDDVPIGEN